jgi:putative hydrolase of the HAD superfamily
MSTDSPGLVLLDAAGTLIHTAEPVEKVYARYFSQFGWIALAAEIRLSFRETFSSLPDPEFAHHPDGDAAERAWWRLVVEKTARAVGIRAVSPEFDACFHALFEHYARPEAWAIYPEVLPILARLRVDGWKLAVVSNFDRRLHGVLSGSGLTESFDLILTSADVSARKPSPLLLQKAMSAFPGATSVCHVGDSSHADGGAAKAAGIPCLILDRPETDLRNLPEWLKITFDKK